MVILDVWVTGRQTDHVTAPSQRYLYHAKTKLVAPQVARQVLRVAPVAPFLRVDRQVAPVALQVARQVLRVAPVARQVLRQVARQAALQVRPPQEHAIRYGITIIH